MNIWDVLILALVAAMLWFALRQWRKGKSGGCSCGCEACGQACDCHKKDPAR